MPKQFQEGNDYSPNRGGYDDGPTVVTGLSSNLGASLTWTCFAAGAGFGLLLAWGRYMIASTLNKDTITIRA